jgi:hypothetical protein
MSKFKRGDKVVFQPVKGNYSRFEYFRRGFEATVMEESDMPIIRFTSDKYSNLDGRVSAAYEEDLVLLEQDLVLA